jgi:phospholipase C
MNPFCEIEPMDEAVETALAALAAGWATVDEISDAVAAQRAQRPLFGQLLLKRRKLNVHQVFEILAEEATSDKLFGQIAVEKGFITQQDVGETLYQQMGSCLPLWQVLVMRGVLTAAQAESIRTSARTRIRKPLEETMVACKV